MCCCHYGVFLTIHLSLLWKICKHYKEQETSQDLLYYLMTRQHVNSYCTFILGIWNWIFSEQSLIVAYWNCLIMIWVKRPEAYEGNVPSTWERLQHWRELLEDVCGNIKSCSANQGNCYCDKITFHVQTILSNVAIDKKFPWRRLLRYILILIVCRY